LFVIGNAKLFKRGNGPMRKLHGLGVVRHEP
jgi:hypothetical protein